MTFQRSASGIARAPSIFSLITSRYDFIRGQAPDGKYTLVMVDTSNGKPTGSWENNALNL
jgi:hypothetical protein